MARGGGKPWRKFHAILAASCHGRSFYPPSWIHDPVVRERFGAYATAYALTGGALNIITIQIGAQIRGDVLHNPGLGYAMALGMVVIMSISLAGYSWLQGRTERWLK